MAPSAPYLALAELSPDQPAAWPVYRERLEFYFQEGGGGGGSDRKAILCSAYGVDSYTLLRSLCAPKTPMQTPYADIVAKLDTHFVSKPSVTVERFRVNKRDQLQGETVPAYLDARRHLACHCEFEDWLDRLLCDRLVCGLRDETLQRRLLAEPELTLTKAVQMARAAEEAAIKTEELRRTRSEARQERNRVAHAPRRPPQW
ncbi:unnamed protein product [Ixodes pacificus]